MDRGRVFDLSRHPRLAHGRSAGGIANTRQPAAVSEGVYDRHNQPQISRRLSGGVQPVYSTRPARNLADVGDCANRAQPDHLELCELLRIGRRPWADGAQCCAKYICPSNFGGLFYNLRAIAGHISFFKRGIDYDDYRIL